MNNQRISLHEEVCIEDFKERSLARYIELWEKRHEEFDRLPDVDLRVARGHYNFFSSVDIELDELEREVKQNGFVLNSYWDGKDMVNTIEQMSLEDYASFFAEERESKIECEEDGFVMTSKQARNFLYGVTDLECIDKIPEIAEGIKEAADLLETLGMLHRLVSNMPGIDMSDSMNRLWVEQRDALLAKLAVQ